MRPALRDDLDRTCSTPALFERERKSASTKLASGVAMMESEKLDAAIVANRWPQGLSPLSAGNLFITY